MSITAGMPFQRRSRRCQTRLERYKATGSDRHNDGGYGVSDGLDGAAFSFKSNFVVYRTDNAQRGIRYGLRSEEKSFGNASGRIHKGHGQESHVPCPN
jgi:hypothetical protein